MHINYAVYIILHITLKQAQNQKKTKYNRENFIYTYC